MPLDAVVRDPDGCVRKTGYVVCGPAQLKVPEHQVATLEAIPPAAPVLNTAENLA